MAHDGYYYNNSSNNYQSTPTTFPLHLCFFLLTLLLFMATSWYLSYESVVESLIERLRLLLILSPLLLLLAVHLLSSSSTNGRDFSSVVMTSLQAAGPERDSLHRAGGSPWGVGVVLVLLLVMVSYQSSFQERWFPLLAR